MSTHQIPADHDSQALRDGCADAFGPDRLVNVTANDQPDGTLAYVFDPDLTTPEKTTLNALLLTTPAAFLSIATPTLAQTAAALKSLIQALGLG